MLPNVEELVLIVHHINQRYNRPAHFSPQGAGKLEKLGLATRKAEPGAAWYHVELTDEGRTLLTKLLLEGKQ